MRRMRVVSLVLGVVLSGLLPPRLLALETLPFEDRVKAQAAIERVYYGHRIWPKENQSPRPSFEAMMSRSQLEAKVADYLKKSNALEKHWQRPITAEQLRAEVERMATHTRAPAVLKEIFAALGNDPYLIAECLARPALAERLLYNWYTADTRFHSSARALAEETLSRLASGKIDAASDEKFSRIVYEIEDGQDGEGRTLEPLHAKGRPVTIRMDAKRFGKLSSDLGSTAPAKPFLREDAEGFRVALVIGKSDKRLDVLSRAFPKVPVTSWWETEKETIGAEISPLASRSEWPALPEIRNSPQAIHEWKDTILDNVSPGPRVDHTAVWTGTEMIIWGGWDGLSESVATGSRYYPSTDSWTATSEGPGRPFSTRKHTAVWTGTEMIVWGGLFRTYQSYEGGRYDPVSNTWTPTSMGANHPSARYGHTAIWTGTEMIVWGGIGAANVNTGGRYDPGSNSWTATSTGTDCPSARSGHTAVWTGTRMIVWGGADTVSQNTGGRYDPISNSWTATSTGTNCPSARYGHTTVWTGTEMIVWGGKGASYENTGGRYDPVLDSWLSTSTGAYCPSSRSGHTAVWTGDQMIVWGGWNGSAWHDDGGRYDPSSNSWTPTSTRANHPKARQSHTAVWTGREMIVWGGANDAGSLETGGRYDPLIDSWTPTSLGANCPSARAAHSAVWTGVEMIVWGGELGYLGFATGGRYDPASDSWTPTSTGPNCPTGRFSHAAVWTGTAMIVWGGFGDSSYLDSGGRYSPSSDSWTPTSVGSGCPSPRSGPSGVWTGEEMLVWGGFDLSSFFNSGGRYDPASNSWTPTSTGSECPSARGLHTAVWTGSKMIVWGGITGWWDSVYTGGVYDPSADSWRATSIGGNCPTARREHSAVWTGAEMIVWGGSNSGYMKTGSRYNPSSESWIPTSTGTNCPAERTSHSAVWTGKRMVVWGGFNSSPDDLNTGGEYDPDLDSWRETSTGPNCPGGREAHTAVWAGAEMLIWGGWSNGRLNTGGAYEAPAPATFVSFTASHEPGGVLVSWETASEPDITGFHVWRGLAAAGPFGRITTDPIPAAGSPAQGADYSYTDTTAEPEETYWYEVEEIDSEGGKALHGPISTAIQCAGLARAGNAGPRTLLPLVTPLLAALVLKLARRKARDGSRAAP